MDESKKLSRPPFDQEIWTTDEAAAFLKISPNLVRSQAKKGRIPGAFQIGTLWRFNRDALIAWTRGDRREQ